MRKLKKYECGLVLFCAVVIFTTIKIATAVDARSQPATVAPAATASHADNTIPTGFNLERYAGLWERNPFTIVTPGAPQAQHSAFEKLFLTSWLKNGGADVAFIQNLETNEAEKITAEPNQDHLRLVALHLNPDPQLVEAVISDGKEQGSVKFRFESQSAYGQAISPVPGATNAGIAAQASNPVKTVPSTMSSSQHNLTSIQTSAVPINQPLAQRVRSGAARAQTNGVPARSSRGRQSEGERLPLPKTSGPSTPGN